MAAISNFSLRNHKTYGGTDFDIDLFFNEKKVCSVSDRHFGIPYEVTWTSSADRLLVEMFLESPEAVKIAREKTLVFREKNGVDKGKPLPKKLEVASFVHWMFQQKRK